MTYTPGPWHCTEEQPSDEWCLVAWVESSAYPGEREWLEGEANARLIAAAPDLLAALQEMVAEQSEVFPPGDWETSLGNARAAIEKATLGIPA